MSSTGFGKQRQGPGAGCCPEEDNSGGQRRRCCEEAGGGPWSLSVLRIQNLAKGPGDIHKV